MKSKVHFAKVSNWTRHKVGWKGFLTRTSLEATVTNPGTALLHVHKNTEINQKPPEYARGLNFQHHKEFLCVCPLCQPVGLANAAERSILVPCDRHYPIGERSFTLELAGCGTTCQKPTNTNFLGPEPSKTVRWDKATKPKTKLHSVWKPYLDILFRMGRVEWLIHDFPLVSPARTACNHKNDLNPVLLLFFISVFRDRNHKV